MKRAYFKCHNCGQHTDWSQANKQDTANRGAARYICNECAQINRYGFGNDLKTHKEKKHGLTIGFELECVPKSRTGYLSMISEIYKLVPTEDSSLPEDGVEFNTPVYQNMSGLKQMFRTFERYADFSHRDCGHHINVGHTGIGSNEMYAIRRAGRMLFLPLLNELRSNSADTKRVFGRDFSFYCNDNMDLCGHQTWLNLANNNRIEFRLAKFVDSTQYMWLAFMCREITEAIYKDFIVDGKDPAKLGKKIVKIYRKYADGKATCQRPERNSKVA